VGYDERVPFTVAADRQGDSLTVVVTGEVDMATAGAMYDAVAVPGASSVTMDLRDVSFFDSAAIQALVRITERYPTGLTVLPSGRVRRVLEICGLASQRWLAPV
jgi:anti-anti-sigma factor